MPFYAEFAELAAPILPTSTSKLVLQSHPQIASLAQPEGGLSAFLYIAQIAPIPMPRSTQSSAVMHAVLLFRK